MELLQILSSRAVRDAEEFASRLEMIAKIKNEAEAEAQRVRDDARRRAQEIVDEAEGQAKAKAREVFSRLKWESEEEAARLKDEAQREAQEIIGRARREAEAGAQQMSLRVRKLAEAKAEEEALRIRKRGEEIAEKEFLAMRKAAEVEAEEMSAKIRTKAEDRANSIREDAEKQAQRIVQKARNEAEAEATDYFSRIKKKAQSEADKLLEDARDQARAIIGKTRMEAEEEAKEKSHGILQRAKQRAIEIEAEAINGVMQAKIQARQDLDRYLALKLADFRQQVKAATPDAGADAGDADLVEIKSEAEASIKQLMEDTCKWASQALDMPPAESPGEIRDSGSPENAGEPVLERAGDQRMPPVAFGRAEGTGAMEARDGEDLAAVVDQSTDEMSNLPARPRLYEGRVEIAVAPPINIARLLAVTRYLEKVLALNILQTAGSWNTGSVVSIALDKPVPLIELLKEIPNVEDVRPLDDGDQAQCSPTIKSLVAPYFGRNKSRNILMTISAGSQPAPAGKANAVSSGASAGRAAGTGMGEEA